MKPLHPLSLLVCLCLLLAGRSLPAQIGFNITSYQGVTDATHQAQTTLLSGQGFRPISLAVTGDITNPRYSAVWRQVGGPTYSMVHGLTESQYLSQSTTWTGQGYRPLLVAASGTAGAGGNAVFAAVWIADGADAVQVPSTSSLDNTVVSQRGSGRRLTSCAQYFSSAGFVRHIAVFEPDDGSVAWGHSSRDDGATFGAKFGEFSLGHGRPAFVTTSDGQEYTHVWRDDRVGNWAMVAGRTSTQLNSDKTLYSGQGMVLTCIAASGTGGAAVYAGIFQERLTPHTRSHSRTGIAVPAMSGFDDYVETFMENNNIRNAALAVTKDGRLVYSRGYTYAEPGSFATQPTTPFRLGSISKALCGTLAHDLIARSIGGFSLNTSIVNYLGINPYDPDATGATIKRCLRHTSGMYANPDPFLALAWANPPLVFLPVDENIIVRYACQLGFGPLDQFDYCNAGNTAVGQVIEQATGQAYMTVLRDRLFAPADTTAIYQQKARPQDFAPGEAPYHMPSLFMLPSDLHMDRRLQSAQYARDYWDCAGGAVSSAMVLARAVSGAYCIGDDSPTVMPATRTTALVRNTLPKVGGGTTNWTDGGWQWASKTGGGYRYYHDGATDGFGAMCVFTTDDICMVLLTNMSSTVGSAASLTVEADAVTDWPSNDLFPTYGMPTFSRRPQLQNVITGTVPNVSDSPLVYGGEGLDQVTSVEFGATTITSQSSNTWHNGYFVRQSPTELRIHPPQGLLPGIYAVRAIGPMGQSAQQAGVLTRATGFAVKAPNTVTPWQSLAAIVSRGPHPDLSLAILTFSTDLQPSFAPGIVDLDIGNMFQTLAVSDARQFTTGAGAVRWDFPTIAGLPQIHFQAVVFNPFLPNAFPMPETAVETVVRVP